VTEELLARPDDAIDVSLVRRVLVVMLRHHGDVLLTTPVYATLRRAIPDVEIDVVVYHETRALLENNPDVREIFSIEKGTSGNSSFNKMKDEWRFMTALRARRYDLLIHLSDHKRGAWLARWLKPRYSIAPRLRRANWFWLGSFTHFYINATSVSSGNSLLRRHVVEQNMDAVRRLGIGVNRPPPLSLVPGPKAEKDAAQFLADNKLEKAYVLIQPTSRWMFKCWPVAQNTALVLALLKKGFGVVLSCGPGQREQDMIEDIVAGVVKVLGSHPVDLVLANVPDTLNRLAALIDRARVFIGIDSAPMHIAAAMGTPSVALFGPSGEDNWGPWKGAGSLVSRVVTLSNFTCRPCGQDGCGGSKVSQCLVQLPVSAVLRAFEEVLEDSDPSHAL
jgi:heptosyltransferase III